MKDLDKEIQTVYFGGGCFWCLEGAFGTIKEIISILPGYMGGTYANPTYDSVCSGETGHAEIIKIDFSSKNLFLEDLLKVFFGIHDPTTINRQGMDIGSQYRSIIVCKNNFQYDEVINFINKLEESNTYNNSIVTEVYSLEQDKIPVEKKIFWKAENEHYRYYERNSNMPYCQAVILPKIEKTKILTNSKDK